jgi:MoxR-like ATPase
MSSSDRDLQEKALASFQTIRTSLHQVIVGMDPVIDALFWTLLCRGHALFVGVPGLAKTLLISSLSRLLGLDFNRIQFTPDMMPSDLIGTEVLEEDRNTGKRHFSFRKGPLFCQLLLADEINRTPPKTQSALLQAMQEMKVTYAGMTHDLNPPFTVFATQNPVESEGTYQLPEAQLDRFLLSIPVDYPSLEDEKEIVRRTTAPQSVDLKSVITAEELIQFQELVRRVPLSDDVLDRIVKLTRSTRPENMKNEELKSAIRFGVGPRASQSIALAAKARALLAGRFVVRDEDVDTVAPFVLRHRLVMKRMRDRGPDQIVQDLITQVS